jgi:G3E family GTPase
MGIEKDILTDNEGNNLGDLYELPSGCLCCVVKYILINNFRDNIVVFIENLIQKKENIKYVLIEAHGYSDISIVVNIPLYRFLKNSGWIRN